ncbi:MAG: transposase [Haliscomenobacter sp.]
MKKSKFSETERLAILAKVDSGTGIDEVCREYQISAATLYKWRKEQADLQDETKRQLKQLESENARLKKMYADLSMNHEILQEGYAFLKKLQAQDNKKK